MPLSQVNMVPALQQSITQLMPTLELALDAACVVDSQNRIVFANLQMKSFLGLKTKDLLKMPVFCDRIKLMACDKDCQLLQAVKKDKRLELDEVPAARGKEKLRIWLRATPLFETGKVSGAVGMVVVVRNTTAELVLQAKYHKLMQMMQEREDQIGDLERRVAALQDSIRKARDRHQ